MFAFDTNITAALYRFRLWVCTRSNLGGEIRQCPVIFVDYSSLCIPPATPRCCWLGRGMYDPPNILYPRSIFLRSTFLAAGCSVAQFPFRWPVAPPYFTTRGAPTRSYLINVELCNAEEYLYAQFDEVIKKLKMSNTCKINRNLISNSETWE